MVKAGLRAPKRPSRVPPLWVPQLHIYPTYCQLEIYKNYLYATPTMLKTHTPQPHPWHHIGTESSEEVRLKFCEKSFENRIGPRKDGYRMLKATLWWKCSSRGTPAWVEELLFKVLLIWTKRVEPEGPINLTSWKLTWKLSSILCRRQFSPENKNENKWKLWQLFESCQNPY